VAFVEGHGVPLLLAHSSVVAGLPRLECTVRRVRAADYAASAAVLSGLVRDGALVWDHGDAVARQFTDAVLVHADGGPRIAASKSRGDVSLLKAVSLAVWAAQQRREPVLLV
jgi:hypothetical protein